MTIAQQNTSLWLETLLTKDPQKMANLYSENATFLPTLSADFKIGRQGVVEYFTHFLAKNPTGKIIKEGVQKIDENNYIHSGFYDFIINSQIISARFTFVWQKINDSWLILHHHSSLMPQE